MQAFNDHRLDDIAARVTAGERLSYNDGMTLFETEDLNGLGRLADYVRRSRHDRNTYFNVNRHLNPTNVCFVDCKFCNFYKKPREEGGYTHTLEECVAMAQAAVNEGASELHIVGGLNSRLPFSYYTDLLRTLKSHFPALHLKAFTMVELEFFSRFYKLGDEEMLRQLIEAGLDSCPGGGAEIFAPRVREEICDHKCDAERWLELAGKVHQAGLHTNATMLYGHIENYEDRVDHMIRLREQQDKTGGFMCFIPLAFNPQGTKLSNLAGPSGIDSLKTIAVSRLMLDNFDHIKAYWVMLGKRLAQVALHYGANDVDGTITKGGELVRAYAVDRNNEVHMSKRELVQLINEAGFEAVERDTVYNVREVATVQ